MMTITPASWTWSGKLTKSADERARPDGSCVQEWLLDETLITLALAQALDTRPPDALWSVVMMSIGNIREQIAYVKGRAEIKLIGIHPRPRYLGQPLRKYDHIWIGSFDLLWPFQTLNGLMIEITLMALPAPLPVGRQILWEDDE
jgi:hypothetical protein